MHFVFTQNNWAQFNDGYDNNGRMSQINQMDLRPTQSTLKLHSNEEIASRVMENLKNR
ncbi:hypothetical protein INQ45_09105 [Flavobacterium columnare]|uniref:hypothetical protein n=1 Tax=Flavobacterium columnare TaxID=996 RepID=UPI002D211877|nr:hypothetical protein [Flavobacterium columnare]MEB3801208.1 hypothetical protein [Flavobacterium columnare]